jgi:hypothetical protein
MGLSEAVPPHVRQPLVVTAGEPRCSWWDRRGSWPVGQCSAPTSVADSVRG